MSFPVFATGDVLNASDMNAVGLWLVKSQTVGSAVSSVAVTSAFSADYDKYLVTLSGGTMSTTQVIGLQLGSTTTNYKASLIYLSYGGAATAISTTTTGANFAFAGVGYTDGATVNLEITNPFATQPTYVRSIWTSKAEAGSYGGHLDNTTSYTGFTLIPAAGTLTGGTIRVYGYRN